MRIDTSSKNISVRPVHHSQFKNISRIAGQYDFSSRITNKSPWVCFSNEFGVSDLSAAGGLGYLAGDWVLIAGKLGIPFVGIGLYYEYKWKQKLDNSFLQTEEYYKTPEPEYYNFNKILLRLPTFISNGTKTTIHVYAKEIGGNLLLMLHESGIRGLYEGFKQTEHRLYQSSVLGFIGMQALMKLNMNISLLHLNESTTVFAGIAWLDMLMEQGLSMNMALKKVQNSTIFTNHTLSPAAEPVWTMAQIKRYVLGNIKVKTVRTWLIDLVKSEGGKINLSRLAITIAGHRTAVSKFHAIKAKETYDTRFVPITNAVANRWMYPEILHMYRRLAIIDPTVDILSSNYKTKLTFLNTTQMLDVKRHAKEDLCNYLFSDRQDQYGNPVLIPEDAKIVLWTRRLDSYKRPGLLFSDPKHLATILNKYHMHILVSGKAHQTDKYMKHVLQKILRIVDKNKILKKRVHFVVNYNWQLARYLGGADIILNTPIPGSEACGTSWEKAVANWLLLCSTRDGGASDIFFTNKQYRSNPPFFEITGTTRTEAAHSLYVNLDRMAKTIDNPLLWKKAVIKQLVAFLPIINGARMMLEYLTLRFKNERFTL